MAWPTTYDEWIARIKKWLDVADLDDDVFGFCIDSANERLNRDLSSQWMEDTLDFTVVDPSEAIDLIGEIPDYNRMRLVTVRGGLPLDAKALNEFKAEMVDNTGTTPSIYCISAQELLIWPLPAAGDIVDIDYYVKVPALSSTRATNIFSKYHPDVLLYASLLEATPFIVEDERLETWGTFYKNISEAINVTAERAKKGSTPLKRTLKVM